MDRRIKPGAIVTAVSKCSGDTATFTVTEVEGCQVFSACHVFHVDFWQFTVDEEAPAPKLEPGLYGFRRPGTRYIVVTQYGRATWVDFSATEPDGEPVNEEHMEAYARKGSLVKMYGYLDEFEPGWSA